MSTAYRVLCVAASPPDLAGSPWGPFDLQPCDSLAALAAWLRDASADALLVATDDAASLALWPALSHAVLDSALVVLAPASPEVAVQLLQLGVQDLLLPGADAETLARALRLAIERKRLEQAARKAYATDLATGLPNHAQLLEHLAHLLALREREPAPMALIALRIEGLARAAESFGAEAANVLRRKAAVRLRSALRASDVVASIGSDAFVVMLAWIDSPQDGERVTKKLANALGLAYTVAGREQKLEVSAGLASYPEHGRDAESLLRRALGQATQEAAMGDEGVASRFDRGTDFAANDEP